MAFFLGGWGRAGGNERGGKCVGDIAPTDRLLAPHPGAAINACELLACATLAGMISLPDFG